MSLRGSSSKIMPKKQQRAVDRGMIPCLATFYGTASLLKTWKMVGTHILANDRQAGWLSCDPNDKLPPSVRVQGAGGVAPPANYHAPSCRTVFHQHAHRFAKPT